MKVLELQSILPGFVHEAIGSQAVFRSALEALSHPGTPVNMPMESALPNCGYGAAAALLLGLLDSDTSLWVSPTKSHSDEVAWLKFHTGCQVMGDPTNAQFLWVAQGDALPPLESLCNGNEAYPDQSATCVIEVEDFSTGEGAWVMQGPGISGKALLSVHGMNADFEAQWTKNHARFPRGVDVFLTTAEQVVGLPRTTQIVNNKKV